MALTYNGRAAEIMLHLVTHSAHGYSQPARAGDGTIETLKLSDGTVTTVHGGDYDCSEAVRMCYVAAGVLPRGCYMWTGNEEAMLSSHHFVRVAKSGVQVGDVLWRSGHTEMVVSVGGRLCQAGFRQSEHHSVSGAKGDQTGWESTYSAYDAGAWTHVWRYEGPQQQQAKAQAQAAPKNPQDAGNPVNGSQLLYRAHVKDYGWLDPVRDGQTAGTTGRGLRMEALKITPPDGLVLTAKVHIQNVGWRDFPHIRRGQGSGTGSSENDPIIGTVGQGLRIEALEIDVESNTTGHNTLRYRSHVQDVGWTGWVTAGHSTGSVGFAKAIEAVQIVLE